MAENKIETELLSQIKEVLLTFPKYWEEDVLLRNKVAEDLRNYNQELIEALLSNQLVKDTYSITLNSTNIFKIEEFISMLRYKNYWENSYTKYSNEIGLTSEGKYLNYNTDVVLDFPHKDSVLEGGMTKEDQGKEEIYYHNVLAKEEIDTLLSSKVFTNIKKYNEDGEHDITEFSNKDNFIIKGNNLVALNSLKERYENKIKMIYIDPPYNTGGDSFKYNDTFNHSSWLTFMKNRLDISKKLLKNNGIIFVQCDDNEQAYLKVLMDNIFGRDNFINVITIKTKIGGVSGSSEGKSIRDATEFINVYANNKEEVSINQINTYVPLYEHIERYREEGKSWKYTSIITELSGKKFLKRKGNYTYYSYDKFESKSVSAYAKENNITEEEVYNNNANKIFRTTNAQSSVRETVIEDTLEEPYEVVGLEYYPIKGKNKNKLTEILYKNPNRNMFMFLSDVSEIIDGKAYYSETITTLWEDIQYNNLSKEGKVDFTNGKKPEVLIKRIIDLATEPKDIILDFFMGSGTTPAVAHKMNRQYIGIEQMDYIDSITVPRLQKVINGEKNGISKDVDWKGGGSFVYAELASLNERYIKDIQQASNEAQLEKVLSTMKENAYLNFKVDLERVSSKDKGYNALSLEEKKEVLIQVLDMNQLYLSYSEIEDEQYKIPQDVKAFNHSFYQKEGVKDE